MVREIRCNMEIKLCALGSRCNYDIFGCLLKAHGFSARFFVVILPHDPSGERNEKHGSRRRWTHALPGKNLDSVRKVQGELQSILGGLVSGNKVVGQLLEGLLTLLIFHRKH